MTENVNFYDSDSPGLDSERTAAVARGPGRSDPRLRRICDCANFEIRKLAARRPGERGRACSESKVGVTAARVLSKRARDSEFN